jgi:EAL domain-containing protein (putative c-di-GMP-specific phosphodiesterase class I)
MGTELQPRSSSARGHSIRSLAAVSPISGVSEEELQSAAARLRQAPAPAARVFGLATQSDLENELEEILRSATVRQQCRPAVVWLAVRPRDGSSGSTIDLHACAERLTARLADGDVLAHVDGLDFAVLVDSVDHPSDASSAARGLAEAFSRPFLGEAATGGVVVSAGVALHPADGDTPSALLTSARDAARRAARSGPGSVMFADSALDGEAWRERRLEQDLDSALERGDFALHFQPMLDRDGRVVAMEALIRWQHPEMGLVPPLEFIPSAERTGQIVPICEWVLAEASRHAAAWERAGVPVRVAVNLSARQFSDPNLVVTVARILRRSGMNPNLLELELTESMLAHPETGAAILNRLHLLGVRVAIDDFGTGFSSLSYLTRLPIDVIKIDRSFVGQVGHDPDAAAVISAVIAMAHHLSLKTVAEGVETEQQARFLAAEGCDLVQGFLYSEPLPAVECEAWLHENMSGVAAPEYPGGGPRPRAYAQARP